MNQNWGRFKFNKILFEPLNAKEMYCVLLFKKKTDGFFNWTSRVSKLKTAK